MLFSELGLSEQLLRAVAEQGYQSPTPIQAQAIPVILQGRDVLAGAQTGTGKTAGFTLPLLHLLQQQSAPQKPRPVRVLILTPTRELTQQVYDSVRTYGKHLPFFSEAIFGGVSIKPQIQKLQRGTDIVVATPGRLLDLIQQQHLDLSNVEYFVLDEADRMLDMGFIRDIRKIIGLLPDKRQNLFFSATYAPEVSALAEQILNEPVEIAVSKRNAAADTVSQLIYPIKREYKRELLSYLIGDGHWQQVLVFVRTKHGADRLCKQLIKDGIRCAALHGDKSQGARTRALDQFKSGVITALIATDIAARGLDIDQLPHVVNFDLPQVAEDYVHRIGRTGRAGSEGQAISLVDPEEAYLLAAIEKLLKREIPRVVDTGYERVSLDTSASKPKSTKKANPQIKPARAQPPRTSAKKQTPRNRGAGHKPADGQAIKRQRADRRQRLS
ncbi:MAG: DEAD/DEAH box helicase [Gammaproteobacteria bacterium]